MNAIRVMHVVEAMHQGGAESMVLEHVRHSARDVAPLVCALNRGGPALEAAEREGARTFMLAKGGGYVSGVRRLARLMRDERVTVVNGHNPTGGLYAALAARLAGVRVVVRTEHSIHYPRRHSAVYFGMIEPTVTAIARRVVCVCDAVRDSHARRLRWAANRFVTVHNGISAAPPMPDREALRARFGFADAERIALTVGSLTTQKAQHVLIEGFARLAGELPAARLLLAGDGPLRSDLEARARASGFGERIRFLGARGDTPELMAAADLFVLSSQREGLPVTLLEAMRAGRPAVATDVGGTREALTHGETGLLVPPHDSRSLGIAMRDLLSDAARSRALGETARARWAGHFTAERMVAETEAIYRAGLMSSGSIGEPEGERHASA